MQGKSAARDPAFDREAGAQGGGGQFARARIAPRSGQADRHKAVTVNEAVKSKDLIIVTIPEKNIPELPTGLFDDVPDSTVVVETGNYYPRQRDGRIEAIENGTTQSRWVEQQLGHAVVKAFNNIYARHLLNWAGRPARRIASRCRWRVTTTRPRPSCCSLSTSWASTASMPAHSTTRGGNSPAHRSTPRTSTPTASAAPVVGQQSPHAGMAHQRTKPRQFRNARVKRLGKCFAVCHCFAESSAMC